MSLRWINDAPADGVSNMARDEALLELVGRGQSPPTLRFYRWRPATISLGYFQPYANYAALAPPARDLPVVRRPTGGGAILHDRELTYALLLPLGHPLLAARGPNTLYGHVHAAFAAWLAGHGVPVEFGPAGAGGGAHDGPFFCFQRHSGIDLLAGGRKIMGSAQRRTQAAVLQHGSLILASRYPQQICAAVADYASLDVDAALPGLARAIAGGPADGPAELAPAESALAEQLRAKYADPAWSMKR